MDQLSGSQRPTKAGQTSSSPVCSSNSSSDIVWISSRLPLGPRPVPRFKHRLPPLQPLSEQDKHWVPVMEPPISSFSNRAKDIFLESHQAYTSQEWSTLRQMLPSSGFVEKKQQKPWGVGIPSQETYSLLPPERLPLINSPMTAFLDDVLRRHDTLFHLHTSR